MAPWYNQRKVTILIESPCIGVCLINGHHHFCNGCFRSEEEIAKWITLNDEEKKEVIYLINKRQIDHIYF
ncbi:MAG: DUF1289 domain-containing protein [Candidatus Methylopumilus sp.]|nr:DUF1289 domain-containing protein [Candidatus Methylopumilus sp.]